MKHPVLWAALAALVGVLSGGGAVALYATDAAERLACVKAMDTVLGVEFTPAAWSVPSNEGRAVVIEAPLRVRVTFQDGERARPLEGALVIAHAFTKPREVSTDANGEARFDVVFVPLAEGRSSGTVYATVSHPCFTPSHANIGVERAAS